MFAFQQALPIPTAATRSHASSLKVVAPRHAIHPILPRTTTRCSMRPYLEKLQKRQNLTKEEATVATEYAVSGEAHVAEIAGFLSMLSAKGETSEEVFGIVDALRKHMTPVDVPYDVLDIVGTGGDGANTVNISTAASILAAAAGCKVAKHGNRSVSSKSGSADVLEALGVNLSLSARGVASCLDQAGISFMFARNHHPSMKYVAPVRKAMKIRTVFNIIGPLINPCGAKRAVIGVYPENLMDTMADVLIESGVTKAVVVHAAGLDEFSNTGVAQVIEINGTEKKKTVFDPVTELDMPKVELSALRGGEASENAQIIRDVLSGKLEGPIADAIALNAGVGCYVYGLEPTIKAGLARVKETIKSGEALRVLNRWVEVSNSVEEPVSA